VIIDDVRCSTARIFTAERFRSATPGRRVRLHA
jgi:hypothetical protein